MFLTLNELSAKTVNLTDTSDIRKLIQDFVIYCRELAARDVLDEVILPEDFCTMPLCESYSISQWFNDREVSVKHRQYLKRFLDKYRRVFNPSSIDGEFWVNVDGVDNNAVGCAFALEHDHTAFSLSTHSMWDGYAITGMYSGLDMDGEIVESCCSVRNLCISMPLEEVEDAYVKNLRSGISSGQDFWDKRQRLYPNLIFCENVKDQLFEDSEKYHLVAVMKKLDRFQEYFSCCTGPYNPKELGMDARTESESVKSNPTLSNYRFFRLPDGSEQYMFDHVGFTGKYNAGRIHFLPDTLHNRCYIGYIGRHLPTQKY